MTVREERISFPELKRYSDFLSITRKQLFSRQVYLPLLYALGSVAIRFYHLDALIIRIAAIQKEI